MSDAKHARMSSERLKEPPIRRSLVAAGIVALWGMLFAALGAPLVGLVLAAAAVLVCAGVLLASRRPSLPRLTLPELRRPELRGVGRLPRPPRPRLDVDLPRVSLAPVRYHSRRLAERVPPLAELARDGAARARAHAVPLAGAAARSAAGGARAAAAPVERRRRRRALVREAWKLNAEGVEHRREGRSRAAVDAHERAVSLFRQLADDRSEGLALNNLGLALMAESDDVGALDAFERSLALLGRCGDRQSEGRVLANLGTLHRRLDRQETALVYWRQALTRLDADSPEHSRMSELVELAS